MWPAIRALVDRLEAITKHGYAPMPPIPKSDDQERFDNAERALRNGIRPLQS